MIWRVRPLPGAKCKPCDRAYFRRWWSDHKGVLDSGKWCRENKDKRKKYLRKWRAANREKVRHQKRQYERGQAVKLKALIAELPCLDCGMRHTEERRHKILARLLPMTTHEIREAWSCIWSSPSESSSSGERLLYRDLAAIGAVRDGGTYSLARESRAA